jgi:hypothetical protein
MFKRCYGIGTRYYEERRKEGEEESRRVYW